MKPDNAGPAFPAQVNVKMTDDLLAGLKEIHAKHKSPPTEVLRGLAEQAVAFFREHGYFTFPVEFWPQSFATERPSDVRVSEPASAEPHAKTVHPKKFKQPSDDRQRREQERRRSRRRRNAPVFHQSSIAKQKLPKLAPPSSP
ncbi:MAG TPA: hypothetical protein VEB66_02265 [Opitutaceae bacterium]|nr:hypothetical protein [Opitutaceae bacterium]